MQTAAFVMIVCLGLGDAEETPKEVCTAYSRRESTFSRLDNVVPYVNAIHFRKYVDDIPSNVEYRLSLFFSVARKYETP